MLSTRRLLALVGAGALALTFASTAPASYSESTEPATVALLVLRDHTVRAVTTAQGPRYQLEKPSGVTLSDPMTADAFAAAYPQLAPLLRQATARQSANDDYSLNGRLIAQ